MWNFKLEKLCELIKDHELWINTEERYGKRLHLHHYDLSNLDLSNLHLRNATFFECDFKNTNFSGSDLTGIDFDNCFNLETIITDEDTLPKMFCPENGSFIGYKKCSICDYDDTGRFYDDCIVKLLIPQDAKRSSGTRNNCRCSKAYVLGFYDFDGNEIKFGNNDKVVSLYSYRYHLEYRLNHWIHPDFFDNCRWHNGNGIYFFMTFEEAVNFLL